MAAKKRNKHGLFPSVILLAQGKSFDPVQFDRALPRRLPRSEVTIIRRGKPIHPKVQKIATEGRWLFSPPNTSGSHDVGAMLREIVKKLTSAAGEIRKFRRKCPFALDVSIGVWRGSLGDVSLEIDRETIAGLKQLGVDRVYLDHLP